GHNAYTKNAGNYWVFEGLGTYFETVEQHGDSLEVGGMVGPRIEEAIKALVDHDLGTPIARFVDFEQKIFNREEVIALHYQQAMALTAFLMQWHTGVYRDDFLEYVRDAYRGRIKRGSGRSLEERLGQPYATLEAQFRAFLEKAREPRAIARPA